MCVDSLKSVSYVKMAFIDIAAKKNKGSIHSFIYLFIYFFSKSHFSTNWSTVLSEPNIELSLCKQLHLFKENYLEIV